MTCSRLFSCILSIPLLAASALHASQTSVAGTFTSDDSSYVLTFTQTAAANFTAQTYSYAGGTNILGATIASGGFDPILTLFDGAGNLLITNDDGPCGTVATDASTGNCFDAFLSAFLTPGNYTLYLTEADNLPNGSTIGDGFSHTGDGDFTCSEFLGQPGAFCDASPSQRSSAFEFDVVDPSASFPTPSTVPEPASAWLFLTALFPAVILRNRIPLRSQA